MRCGTSQLTSRKIASPAVVQSIVTGLVVVFTDVAVPKPRAGSGQAASTARRTANACS